MRLLAPLFTLLLTVTASPQTRPLHPRIPVHLSKYLEKADPLVSTSSFQQDAVSEDNKDDITEDDQIPPILDEVVDKIFLKDITVIEQNSESVSDREKSVIEKGNEDLISLGTTMEVVGNVKERLIATEEEDATDKGRIVGGNIVAKGNFPFMASLRNKRAKNEGSISLEHYCGGAILSSRTVITAAHCIKGSRPSDLYVALGDHDLNDLAKDEITLQAVRIIIHPNYNPATFDADLGLVILERDIVPGPHLKKISLMPTPDFLERNPDLNLTVMGWGALFEGGPGPSVLSAVRVPFLPLDKCRFYMRPRTITDGMFCAGDVVKGGKDSCQGDSGGPIVYSRHELLNQKERRRNLFIEILFGVYHESRVEEDFTPPREHSSREQLQEEEEYVLTGVVSWGIGCAQPGLAGIYTNVPYFNTWIQENTV